MALPASLARRARAGHARVVTDEALRRSARAAAATDDVAARARLLGDELRAGLRSRGDVELLAYLADPAALLLLDEPPPDLSGEDGPVLWMRGFLAWGPEVLARAVVAWLWGWLEDQPDRGAIGPEPGLHETFLAAVAAWWSAPTRAARAAVEAAWHHDLATVALDLTRVIRAPDVREIQECIEHVLSWDPSSSRLPAPPLVGPRLRAWPGTERSRRALQSTGTGPTWRRAVDLVTPSIRRELVARLRARQGQLIRLTVRGQTEELLVEQVTYEQVTLPMMRVDLDHVALPS